MSKATPQYANLPYAGNTASAVSKKEMKRNPLAELVHAHLQARGLRQIDFCRETGFDQGLLSKILSSVVNTLNVETTLKLAEGLNLRPVEIFAVMGKREVDDLLRRFYAQN